MLERFQNYIGGKFVDAGDGRTFDSLDPYAGAAWAAIPEGSTEDIDNGRAWAAPPANPVAGPPHPPRVARNRARSDGPASRLDPGRARALRRAGAAPGHGRGASSRRIPRTLPGPAG